MGNSRGCLAPQRNSGTVRGDSIFRASCHTLHSTFHTLAPMLIRRLCCQGPFGNQHQWPVLPYGANLMSQVLHVLHEQHALLLRFCQSLHGDRAQSEHQSHVTSPLSHLVHASSLGSILLHKAFGGIDQMCWQAHCDHQSHVEILGLHHRSLCEGLYHPRHPFPGDQHHHVVHHLLYHDILCPDHVDRLDDHFASSVQLLFSS